jgi:hypothetical protein
MSLILPLKSLLEKQRSNLAFRATLDFETLGGKKKVLVGVQVIARDITDKALRKARTQ